MAERQPEGGINVTGSDRPSLKDLYDHVVMKVADKWKDLGVHLLRSDQERMLDIIEADYSHDAVRCCKRLFTKWLNTTEDATWNMLIKALRSPSVQLDYLAGQLEEMLITESAVTSGTGAACEEIANLTIQQIEIQFAKMTGRIKQALISNNVDVASLIEQLCIISAVKNKKVPLFDEDVFERIKSIGDFWKKLRAFWSIFDYELLQCIVEISECKEAQDILAEFLSRIDPSAIEDVDLVLHCKVEDQEGSLKPVLRIKVNSKKCTLSIKKSVEEIVSKTYDLDRHALRFQGIKEGCIELFYYISKSLELYLMQFKISQSIWKEFLIHKIISIYIDETKIVDNAKKTSTSEQSTTMAVVESAKPKSHPSSDDEETVIINEGFPKKDEIQIRGEVFNICDMMRVNQDGSIFAARSTHDQTDFSYKFIQYNLNIPSKDRTTVQPKVVLLESLYLPHHFVHWDVPSLSVTCKLTTHTGDGEPPININSSLDQQFVWVIATEDSNQFALQTYDKPYFLMFGADSKASLYEGADPEKNKRFRFERLTWHYVRTC